MELTLFLSDRERRLSDSVGRLRCRGSSGFVLLALDRVTMQQVAVKCIPTGPSFKVASVQRELTNQAMCSSHPHIVQILVTLSHWCCSTSGFLSLRMLLRKDDTVPPAFATDAKD